MEIVLKPCDLRAPTAEEHILAYHGVTFIGHMTREELEREFPMMESGMRDITGPIDQMKGIVVVEFDDGKRINFDAKAVQKYGLRTLVREYAPEYQAGPPLPVFQRGKQVGTLSASWHPSDARRSLMYEPRPGDFLREGDRWIADPMLGPGDLLHAGVNMIDKPEW